MASVSQGGVGHRYIPTGSYAGKSILTYDCGEIQLTQEKLMNRKRFQAIASLSFVLILILDAGRQAQAQEPKGPYPNMAPLEQ